MEPKKISENVWEIEKQGEMLVNSRIYADDYIMEMLMNEAKEKPDWNSLTQIKNCASLRGIQKNFLALADVHCGYGAPIGGVGAFDMQEGVIVFGLIGFDINCSVRCIKTPLNLKELEKKKMELANELYEIIPAGLGKGGKLKLSLDEIDELLVKGLSFAVKRGYGLERDIEFTEANGQMKGAEPEAVSKHARQRMQNQVGTLGSGNHYLEVQFVEEIFDEETAKAYGLFKEQIVAFIHCGSRGLGHQVGSDYLKILDEASKKYGIKVVDRELVCAPIQSEEGQKYFSAVKAAMNCAFANKQMLGHLARQCFSRVFGIKEEEVELLYDVAHNTAKVEKHKVDGKIKELLVHRKGSTRGFGPGREEIPEAYRKVGQPILIGGTMGTASYILAGTEKGMEETFGSSIHGAGRFMSRTKAIKKYRGNEIVAELARKGIIVKGHGMKGIAEEAPGAYKDIDNVVNVMHNTGISRKVARLKPLIVVKG